MNLLALGLNHNNAPPDLCGRIGAVEFCAKKLALLDAMGTIAEARDSEQLAERFFDAVWRLVGPEALALAVPDRDGAIRHALLRADARKQPLYLHDGFPEPLGRLAVQLRVSGSEARTQHRGLHWLAMNGVSAGWRREILLLATRRPLPCDWAPLGGLARVYRNLQSLLDDSQRDKLTGLRNRRTLLDSLAQCLDEARSGARQKEPGRRKAIAANAESWLAVMDIDHFKCVNDRFGHVFGDEVLVLIAHLMNECFRDNDLLFRVGGEEFVVVLMVPGREGAEASLERFRRAVEAHRFPQVGVVTVSIGAARIAELAAPTDMFDRADQVLYRSKENGRNRITFYEDLREGGVQAPRTGSVELVAGASGGLGADAGAVSPMVP
jgi:diguanylate cyclase (GGDEF)-like protein